jgi:hypothetical protein
MISQTIKKGTFMSNKLFVVGFHVNGQRWPEKRFCRIREVVEAKVISDRTRPSRGFVLSRSLMTKRQGRVALNGTELDGRTIRVDVASEKRSGGGGAAAAKAGRRWRWRRRPRRY